MSIISKLKKGHKAFVNSACDIETSQLICFSNQLTGFYMMTTLAFNELIKFDDALRYYIYIAEKYCIAVCQCVMR